MAKGKKTKRWENKTDSWIKKNSWNNKYNIY